MDLGLAGKVAVVTGAGSGMGAATAHVLAAEGALVVPCDRNQEAVAATAASIGAQPVVVDVTDSAACDGAIAQAIDTHGHLDVLVNAAGIIVRAQAWETSDQDWERIFAVNVHGLFYMCRAAIPHMRSYGGGAIVNFGSVWGTVGSVGAAAYTATKGAVHQLTRSMALEHATENIRVNAVCPGEIDTPMLSSERSEPVTREFLEQLAASAVPTGRLGGAEEVARVVAFVASPAASYMTGTMVGVDAGFVAQ